ncbi:MAG: hypothetical protein AAB498_00795 [Patescibacteria group bacterium]
MNKNILIAIIVIVAAVVIGFVVWFIQSSQAPTVPVPLVEDASKSAVNDTVSAVNSEIEKIDIGDLDKEFQDIDADFQSL